MLSINSTPATTEALRIALDRDGFFIVRGLFTSAELARVIEEIEGGVEGEGVRRRGRSTYAVRNCLRTVPRTKELADAPPFRLMMQRVLGGSAQVTRAILFDKNPDANWAVPWHQDTTIAVNHRAEVPGFGPWSVKSGVSHVQPPAEVLEHMLTARIHLDPCDESNGALRILPTTHLRGFLDASDIELAKSQHEPAVCEAAAGDVLFMRPLVLHASSPSVHPSHRRILHLEFAAKPLPGGLSWCDA